MRPTTSSLGSTKESKSQCPSGLKRKRVILKDYKELGTCSIIESVKTKISNKERCLRKGRKIGSFTKRILKNKKITKVLSKENPSIKGKRGVIWKRKSKVGLVNAMGEN